MTHHAYSVAMWLASVWAGSPGAVPEPLSQVEIEQHVGAQLPTSLEFTNAEGRKLALGELFDGRPVVLALVYYECPMLCTLVLNGMLRVFNVLKFGVGREFDVITVSIDPRESAALAQKKKALYLKKYAREQAADGWHFLVGDADNIKQLAQRVGFSYHYDEKTKQFAHASGIMVLTPDAQISRYFFGIDYSPGDLRLALVEASQRKIGSVVDAFLLYCFHYDPTQGRYSLSILNAIRLAGVATVLLLVLGIGGFLLKERREGATSARSPRVFGGLP